MFLYILSWIAMIFHVIFLTLALAAALFYLAELVEEYTVLTAKVIKFFIAGTSVVYLGLLLLEGFPVSIFLAGIFSNGLYVLLLKDFPFIELTSPVFIAGVAMVFINHYLAFNYFSSVWYPFSEVCGDQYRSDSIPKIIKHWMCRVFISTDITCDTEYSGFVLFSTKKILGYFTICLWILPFAFFVSLSASENVLPTASAASEDTNEPNYAFPGQKSSHRHGILALFNFLSKKTESYLPTRTKRY